MRWCAVAAAQPRQKLSSASDPNHDLRRLEAYCQRATDRCAALEDNVARLQHDIEGKLSQWDSMLSALSTTEEKARVLTDTLTGQLHSLRANTGPQVKSAKDEVEHSRERVGGSEEQLEGAEKSIERAREALLQLERKLVDEEATLRKIESWQQALVWLTVFSVALLAILLVYLFGRPDF
ncbi:hypothetical protein JCM6882_006740 [Rhodosporidiobolus microsporus]